MNLNLTYFRLEFNEKQQAFHHAYPHQKHTIPNTHGWVTIADYCTDDEFLIFECYLERIPKKKLTTEYVMQSMAEIKSFTNNLIKSNFGIVNNFKNHKHEPE